MTKDEEWLLAEKYNGEKTDAFFADCKRLSLGEPLAYLIGYTPFLGTTIYLDSKPLIPRPETEYWTEKATESMGTRTNSLGLGEEPLRVLDLCAGSGAIGVAVAHAVPDAHVDFVEIDDKHLPTIEKNLSENSIDTNRTHIIHSNLFQKVSGKYNFILTNPPYIDSDLNRVDDSVTLNEPHLALFGGKGGLEVITQIITTASDYLLPGGQLLLEHEPEQADAIATLAAEKGFSVEIHPDQYDVLRYAVLVSE